VSRTCPPKRCTVNSGFIDAGLGLKRINETVHLRTGNFVVEDTWSIWEKRLADVTP
jgi:hypothetical protein